jgi:hypothetical protein
VLYSEEQLPRCLGSGRGVVLGRAIATLLKYGWGVVLDRAVATLRSVETHPLAWRILIVGETSLRAQDAGLIWVHLYTHKMKWICNLYNTGVRGSCILLLLAHTIF